jgi:hypothetical protein
MARNSIGGIEIRSSCPENPRKIAKPREEEGLDLIAFTIEAKAGEDLGMVLFAEGHEEGQTKAEKQDQYLSSSKQLTHFFLISRPSEKA